MKKFMMLLCLISMGDLYARAKPKDKITEATTELKGGLHDGAEQVQTNLKSGIDTKKETGQENRDANRKQMLEEKKTEVTAGMDLRGKNLKIYRFSQPNLQNIIMDSTTKNEKGSTDNEDGTSTQEDPIQFDLSPSHYNGVHADLSGAILSGANLTGMNLTGANLTNVDLSGANLTNVNLTNANLTGANLTNVDLSTVILAGANLTNANLTGAIFSGVDLSNPATVFIKTTLVNANMSLGTFIGNNFNDANMQSVNMSGSNCTNAKFKNTQMQNANFTTFYWTDVKANIVYSFPTDLTNADVSGADLTGVRYDANTKLPATMTPVQKASMILVQ